MQNLRELQKQFIDKLYNESSSILDWIHSSTLLPEQHFSIYQNSIHGILQKALQEVFPVCMKLVGEDFFVAMINEFIAATRSTSPNLGDFGAFFSDFIATFEPAKVLPYLSDVARLEWAWHQLYDAANAETFDLQKFTELDDDQAEYILFALPPGASLISSTYPILEIWKINQDESATEETIHLDLNQYYYFIWRKQLEKRIDPLSFSEWQVLTWIQEGLTLGNIADKITNHYSEINLSEILPKLILTGWISAHRESEGIAN